MQWTVLQNLIFNSPNFLLCMTTGYSRAKAQVSKALCRVLRIFSKVMDLKLEEARKGEEAVEIWGTGQDQEKFRRWKDAVFFLISGSRHKHHFRSWRSRNFLEIKITKVFKHLNIHARSHASKSLKPIKDYSILGHDAVYFFFDGYRCFRVIPALRTEDSGLLRNVGSDIRRSPRHIPEDRQLDTY